MRLDAASSPAVGVPVPVPASLDLRAPRSRSRASDSARRSKVSIFGAPRNVDGLLNASRSPLPSRSSSSIVELGSYGVASAQRRRSRSHTSRIVALLNRRYEAVILRAGSPSVSTSNTGVLHAS